jgi:hypothetical protein
VLTVRVVVWHVCCRIRASEREDRTPSGDAAALRQSLPLEFDAHFKEGSMGATLTVDSRKNAMVSHRL